MGSALTPATTSTRKNPERKTVVTDETELPKYYSTVQVAEMFEVKVGTVRDWIRQGRLNAMKLSGETGQWRVTLKELQRFANKELEKKR